MSVFIERVNPVPIIENDELSEELKMWLENLVDTLNSAIEQIETELNP